MDFVSWLPLFLILAVILVVVFTELIKRLDRYDKLRGYRVWVPAVLSVVFAGLLYIGQFFRPAEVWFWGASIFGFSVFFYEAILKKIQEAWHEKRPG